MEFCSERRAHEPECEHYAIGGVVPLHQDGASLMAQAPEMPSLPDQNQIKIEDPEFCVGSVLAHLGAEGLFGDPDKGLFDSLGMKRKKSSQARELEDKKIGQRIRKHLTKVALSTEHASREAPVDAIIGKGANWVGRKYAGPLIEKMLVNGHIEGASDLLDYATNIARGENDIDSSVGDLFKEEKHDWKKVTEDDKDKIKKYVASGALTNELQDASHFAQGGMAEAHENVLAKVLPSQNVLLNAAKGRVYQYLNSVRPLDNMPRLAFDRPVKDEEKLRVYDRAVTVAAHPLSVLKNIKKGTITPELIHHLSTMYPEVKAELDKKITEHIIRAENDERKPSHHVRMGLAMLLGTPLGAEMTPPLMMAAQASFKGVGQAQQPMPQGRKPKKNTAPLSKAANEYLTDDQAAERRQQSVDR